MKKILFISTICLICSISVFSQSKKKWEQTQSLNSITAYEDFITQYPDGKYTELAKKELDILKQQEALKAQEAKEKEEFEAQKISKSKAESAIILANNFNANNLVSPTELEKLKQMLLTQADPYTFKDLYDLVTSKEVPDGGNIGKSGWNTAKTTGINIDGTTGEKVDVISTSKNVFNIELQLYGLIRVFSGQYFNEYNPKCLFTLLKPSYIETSGIHFERIIIWDSFTTVKKAYLYKDGNWYFL